MIGRALTLYKTFILEFLHRLRHDWARELVVLTASLVLFATFFYIFNDFLNVEVRSLSTAMRDRFAQVLAYLAWGLGAVAGASVLRRERVGDRTLSRAARTLGETSNVIVVYTVLRSATALAVVHGIVWALVRKSLVQPDVGTVVVTEMAMILVSIALAYIGKSEPERNLDVTPANFGGEHSSQVQVLTAWRSVQMLHRSRLARVIFGVALLLLLLLPLAAYRGAPTFVTFVISVAAGYVVSLALIFQLADDLPNSWTERGLGVTHDQFMSAYERLSQRLGLVFGVIAAVLVALGRMGSAGVTLEVANEALKVLVVTALPSLIVPWIMLQIEGRRPGVNATLTLIAALFVGTAVYANWLSLLLPLLLRYYALQTQAGRFYRA